MAQTDGMALDPANIVRSERIEIDAPASVVWEILTDFAAYKAWNPFCVECDSKLEMGAAVNMKLASYTMPGQIVGNVEYICAIEPERLISWELPFMEIWPYPARRDQIIEPLGDDRCAYSSTDAFFQDNGTHVMRFCGDWVKRAFDDTAIALKARAEQMHASRKAA